MPATHRDKLREFQLDATVAVEPPVAEPQDLRADAAMLTKRASAARGAAALSKMSVVKDGPGPPSVRSADVFGKPPTAIKVPLNLKTTMNGRMPVALAGLEPSQETIPVAGIRKYLVMPRRDPPDVLHLAMRDGRERWVIQEGHTRAAAARLRGEETIDARVWEFTENASGELVPVPRGLQKRGMKKAFLLYGTTEGQIKGWETRRAGGGPRDLDDDGVKAIARLPRDQFKAEVEGGVSLPMHRGVTIHGDSAGQPKWYASEQNTAKGYAGKSGGTVRSERITMKRPYVATGTELLNATDGTVDRLKRDGYDGMIAQWKTIALPGRPAQEEIYAVKFSDDQPDAISLYGTSEGILKGWETRRRGGGGAKEDEPASTATAPEPASDSIPAARTFGRSEKVHRTVMDALDEMGERQADTREHHIVIDADTGERLADVVGDAGGPEGAMARGLDNPSFDDLRPSGGYIPLEKTAGKNAIDIHTHPGRKGGVFSGEDLALLTWGDTDTMLVVDDDSVGVLKKTDAFRKSQEEAWKRDTNDKSPAHLRPWTPRRVNERYNELLDEMTTVEKMPWDVDQVLHDALKQVAKEMGVEFSVQPRRRVNEKKKLSYREQLRAFQLYGTTEGILKGWETRRGHGGGAQEQVSSKFDADTPEPVRHAPTEENHKTFRDRFEASFKDSPKSAFVTHYTVDEMQQGKMIPITANGGKTGMLIHDHGDGRIEGTALFNTSKVKGAGIKMLEEAVKKHGVNYVEAFGPTLPQMYAGLGFETVEEYPFDPAQAPANWNTELFGTPNYHIMRLKKNPPAQP